MLKFIVISAIVITIVFWWKNHRFFALTKLLRHNLRSYPVLGISHLFFGDNVAHMRAVQTIGHETNKQGGIIASWFGTKVYVSITDPVFAEFLLKTCLEKDEITRFSRLATGNGTIFAPVAIWRRRRKMVAAAFRLKNLTLLVDAFAKKSDILVENLSARVGTGPVPLWSYLNTYSVDSVCETTLGVDLQSQKDPRHPFLENFAEGVNLIATRTCQPWLHSDLIYRRLPYHKKLVKAVEFEKNFVNEIVNAKREKLLQAKDTPSPINPPHIRTLLEILLKESEEKQGLTNEELQEEMLTFMVAGTDTTAIAAGFTLLMLARHPDVQDLVYNELREVMGKSRLAAPEDLAKLKYLDLVIKETLRLYPPGVVVLRKVETDVELPSGIVLPAGCGIAVNIWAMHRNPTYWGPDAEQFKPDRFLRPLKHPTQYIPFSSGPRNCIGYQFALLSMKSLLSTILRRFKVTPATKTDGNLPPVRLKFDFLLKNVDNFSLCLERKDV